MATAFDVITEEFKDDAAAIRLLVNAFSASTSAPKTRIAAANSATLLLAATFEEYIREMARQYARAVVSSTPSFDKLPTKMASTVWKRTMDGLSRIKVDSNNHRTVGHPFGGAQARFSVVYDFCKGDLTQDIYRDLIHNENNMRPGELNGLFKTAGLSDTCTKCSDKAPLLQHFGQTEPGKAHGLLLVAFEDFFERRNVIAHALNARLSSSPSQITGDLDLLEKFADALTLTLNALAPQPLAAQVPAVHTAAAPSPAAPVTPPAPAPAAAAADPTARPVVAPTAPSTNSTPANAPATSSTPATPSPSAAALGASAEPIQVLRRLGRYVLSLLGRR